MAILTASSGNRARRCNLSNCCSPQCSSSPHEDSGKSGASSSPPLSCGLWPNSCCCYLAGKHTCPQTSTPFPYTSLFRSQSKTPNGLLKMSCCTFLSQRQPPIHPEESDPSQ